jgi:hypothetical protein
LVHEIDFRNEIVIISFGKDLLQRVIILLSRGIARQPFFKKKNLYFFQNFLSIFNLFLLKKNTHTHKNDNGWILAC